MQELSTTLARKFASGWPFWRTGGQHDPHFVIHLAEDLRKEAKKMSLDPATIISKARRESQKEGAFEDAWKELEHFLATMIYGSNFIESAGTGLHLTLKICRDVFSGKGEVDPNIDEYDPDYKQYIDNLVDTQRTGDTPNVVRSRREVVNHATALSFLVNHVVINNMALSEDLILQAHQILQDNIDDDVLPGQYRDHEVAVSYTKPGQKRQRSICIRARAVPQYMRDMTEHLHGDIEAAGASGYLDPYTLAARYHHQFVMIHPFGDGNGRMSRMILNVLLLKYAGHLSIIGNDGDKDEYLDIVRRGQQVFSREDMEVDHEKQTSHLEFARHVVRKSRAGLEDMCSWESRKERV